MPDERARNGDFSHFRNTTPTADACSASATRSRGRPHLDGEQQQHTPAQQLNYTGPPACATCATGLNVMDPAQIDPIAKRILALMPLPNHEGTGAGGFSNNWSRRQTIDTRRNNFDAKVNLNRTNAHQMWFKLSYMYANVPDRWTFPAPGVGETETRVYQPTFGQTWVLSPTLTFDTTLGDVDHGPGSLRRRTSRWAWSAPTCWGFRARTRQGRTDVPRAHLYAGHSEHPDGVPDDRQHAPPGRRRTAIEKTISFTSNLTKFAGRHEFRGGYTLFRSKLDHWQPERQNPRGSFAFRRPTRRGWRTSPGRRRRTSTTSARRSCSG